MSLQFKRNYPILLILVSVIVILSLTIGNQRVIAYTSAAASEASTASTEEAATSEGIDISNDVALFDDTVVHSIQVIMDTDEYDEMISTYQNTGLKEYFHADILIDGVRVNNVGIRLKGNASLRTSLGGGMGGRGGFPGMGQLPEGGDLPAMGQAPAAGDRPVRPGNGQPPAGMELPDNLQAPAGMGGFGAAESGEVKIPFLIKFDEYVNGQSYQGYTFLSIRNYGTSYNAAMLQEPVTNNAVQLIGLPATQTAYTGFSINDAEETLYVISEILDETYLAENFENANGILYKSELGSTLSYEGEDPSAYADSFTQETRKNEADMAPLIAFMRFLDQSDDATFEAELPNYLDVEAFAAYLAVNNLLVNTDSMIGMNNNYYLYYDDVAGRFTLLMWDANESLGKLGGSASYEVNMTGEQQSGMGGRGGFGGGMGGGSNTLMTRFLANATFKALYLEKAQMIYEQAFASGAIRADIERYAELIRSVNDERSLVDLTAYDTAVESTLSFIQQRTEYLATSSLMNE